MNISNDRPHGRRLHVAGMVLAASLVAAACVGGDEAAKARG